MKGLPSAAVSSANVLSRSFIFHVHKDYSAREATFIPPKTFCMHLIFRSHELCTHLQYWVQPKQSPEEQPSWMLYGFMRCSRSAWRQCLGLRAITGCSCMLIALLCLSTGLVGAHWGPGTEAICFCFPSPCKFLHLSERMKFLVCLSFKRLSGNFLTLHCTVTEKRFPGGLTYNKAQITFCCLISRLRVKFSKTYRWGMKDLSHSYISGIRWSHQLSGSSQKNSQEWNFVHICEDIFNVIQLETTCQKTTGHERTWIWYSIQNSDYHISLTESLKQSFRIPMDEGFPAIFQKCSNWSPIM